MTALNLYYRAMLMAGGEWVKPPPSWAIKQTRNLEDFGDEY